LARVAEGSTVDSGKDVLIECLSVDQIAGLEDHRDFVAVLVESRQGLKRKSLEVGRCATVGEEREALQIFDEVR